MTIEHVEINQVGHQQTAGRQRVKTAEDFPHTVPVARAWRTAADAPPGEQVADFTNSLHHLTCLRPSIKQGRPGRGHGKIPAPRCPVKALLFVADERPRNDPADVVAVGNFPNGTTKGVQLFGGQNLFMDGNLENRIDTGINDRPTGSQMLRPEPSQNLRTARCDIAEGRHPGQPLELLHQLCGKTFGKGRKRDIKHRAGKFPVPGRAVLASRTRPHATEAADRLGRRRHPCNTCQMTQAQRCQVWQTQATAGLRDMRQGGRISITVPVGIGESADADAVQHDPDRPPAFRLHAHATAA